MSKYLTLLYSAFKHKSLENFRNNCYEVVQLLKNSANKIETNEDLAKLLRDYQMKHPQDLNMSLENIIAFYYNFIEDYDIHIPDINYSNISSLVQVYNLTTIANILDMPSYLDKMMNTIKQNMQNYDTSYLDKNITTLGDLLDFVEFMPLGLKVAHGIM